MTPAYVVEITTPKKFLLNGLWFGPKKTKKAFIFVHGLTASAFSMQPLIGSLAGPGTAVLAFNNRGFEQVAEVKRKRRGRSEWIRAGAGREVFTDCYDDIQGAIDFAKKRGVKEIYLVGHSTGSQKICYWAYKNKRERKVKALVLLAPLSDYAIALEEDRNGKLKRSIAFARKLLKAGKPHEVMPKGLGPWFVCDAQRFLSLYTPDSKEEIFLYGQPGKRARVLGSINIPMQVFLAGDDEHGQHTPREIASWFEKSLKNKHKVVIVPKAGHSFRGAEKGVAKEIQGFTRTS